MGSSSEGSVNSLELSLPLYIAQKTCAKCYVSNINLYETLFVKYKEWKQMVRSKDIFGLEK